MQPYCLCYISSLVNILQFSFSLSYTGPKILLYTFHSKTFNCFLSLFVRVEVSNAYVNNPTAVNKCIYINQSHLSFLETLLQHSISTLLTGSPLHCILLHILDYRQVYGFLSQMMVLKYCTHLLTYSMEQGPS